MAKGGRNREVPFLPRSGMVSRQKQVNSTGFNADENGSKVAECAIRYIAP